MLQNLTTSNNSENAMKRPFTSAQQCFLERMQMNNVNARAMRIVKAALIARNEMPAPADHDLATVCDEVCG